MTDVAEPPVQTQAFLAGGGEMGALIQAFDWAATSLGPIDRWPQSLKTATGLLLLSPLPIVMLWGEDGIMLYNDAYSVFAAGRHPQLLGSKVREGWPEVADFNDNVMKVGLEGGTLSYKDQELTLYRTGAPEQVWMNLDYSPVPGDDGRPAGVIAFVVETTEQVLAEQRLVKADERLQLALSAGSGIGAWDWDVPADLVYADERFARLYGVSLEKAAQGAPIAEFFRAVFVDDLPQLQRAVDAAMKLGGDFRCEYRLVQPDGSHRWVSAQGRCTFDARGEPMRFPGVSFDISDAKKAQNALQQSEEQLRLAVDAAEIGFWDVDVVNDTLYWPARVKAMFGISPEVPVSMADFYAGLHPDDAPATAAAYAAAADPEVRGLYDVEYRTIGKEDGVIRWVAAKGRGVFNEAGQCVRVIGTAIDITERANTQAALRKSEAQLRELNASLEQQVAQRTRQLRRTWDVSPEILGILNQDGFFEQSNPAWRTVLGWSEQEIRTTRFFDFIHPDDLIATEAAWEAATERGEPALRFENRYRTMTGDYRWLSWIAVPEGDKVYCTARDITAEKRQADALAQSNADRERIWRNTQDVFTVIDLDGVLQSVNPAVEKRLGWSPEDMLGRSVLDFIHPDDRPPLETDGQFIEDRYREPRVFPNRFLHKDGGYRFMAWFSSLHDGLIYSSGRDVTLEREQAETLKAVEEELRQSQKMEAVGQLTGGIAHDFNNLLAGISGSLELLERRLAQGRMAGVERYITAAQGASRRAADLTQRLLAFSRRQTLDPKPTDVNRLIGGMEELIRRSVGPNVQVEVVGAGGLWLTKVDPSQLENALLNLCINARDAMAPDGGRVTIETANKWLDERHARERDMVPGQYISLCVTDTGTGMTPEVIARAFDPFFTTKPMGEGTGLGLSMTYGFVRQSGGQVRIYSAIGEGTTMCLYLPRHFGEGGDAVEARSEGLCVDPAEGAGETVLVIDDEPTVRMVVVEVLAEHGYTALEAVDGPSGLRLLQSDARIDLLVTDVGLPGGLNGRQIADAARLMRPDLKVLFITGYAENAAVGNGLLDAGMQVITKPFLTAALGAKIRAMIDGQGSGT